MNTRLLATISIVVLAIATAPGQAPLGTTFIYQGQLQQTGSPASGLHDLRFRLYDALAGGAQVGSTLCADNVNVTDGLFTLPLDFGAQFAGQQRFLEIDVRADTGLGCGNGTGFVTLSPRQPLTAAPNALFASSADLLDGLNSTAFLQTIPVPLTLGGTSSTHIIRADNASLTNGSSSVLGVTSAATGETYGVSGLSLSSSQGASGVYGVAAADTGVTYGGRFDSNSTSGRAVSGFAGATSGTTYGVLGQSHSTSGRGVAGFAYAVNGQTIGVYGESNSSTVNATGVYGMAAGGFGSTYGGFFNCTSTSGTGVFGFANANAGITFGVSGQSNSSSEGASGVYGLATAGSGVTYGGRFDSNSTSGRAVSGYAGAASGPTYGVLGQCVSPTGYGVFCGGRFAASGTKNFRIDHPDDPQNKYLLHYSAESPEVINFYRGTVVLDGAGEAVVALPHYFAKINKMPSYVLTAVGAPMPMLHVAEEIEEAALGAGASAEPGDAAPPCSFRVAGGAPGAKVSWRVEAVRNDRWVQQRGAPVEVEKQGLEKGTYQHPDLYGQPAEKGMNYYADRVERGAPADSLARE